MTHSATSPDSPNLLVEMRSDVLVLTLNRVQSSNALDSPLLTALLKAFEAARFSECKGVVITGAGRSFSAGADIKAFAADPAALSLRGSFNPVILAMNALGKPIVAAVNGAAAGGGLSLALAADVRILATTARLRPAWGARNLAPDVGASWYLPRLMGTERALRWLAEGGDLSSEAAFEAGVASCVVSDDSLLDNAVATAVRMSALGSAFAPTRSLLYAAAKASLAEQLEHEASMLDHIVSNKGDGS